MTIWSDLADLPEGDHQIINDFDKRYTNSFLLITVRGETIPVKYNGMNGNNKHSFTDVNNLQYELGDKTKNSVAVWFPPVGCYNINGMGCTFWILPERQWKRAPCKDNTSIDWYSGQHSVLTLAYFHECWTNKYPTIQQCFAFLQDKQNTSIAFSIRYALVKHTQTLYLYHHDVPIGIYQDGKFNPIIPEFTQDITDFYRRHQL